MSSPSLANLLAGPPGPPTLRQRAANPKATPEELEAVLEASGDDIFVRFYLAANPAAPLPFLHRLLRVTRCGGGAEEAERRMAALAIDGVGHNPATPLHVLADPYFLIEKKEPYVRSTFSMVMSLLWGTFWDARSPSVTPLQIERILDVFRRRPLRAAIKEQCKSRGGLTGGKMHLGTVLEVVYFTLRLHDRKGMESWQREQRAATAMWLWWPVLAAALDKKPEPAFVPPLPPGMLRLADQLAPPELRP